MNKFRKVTVPQQVIEAARLARDPEIDQFLLDGGIVLNRSAQLLELNQSPMHDRVRVEKGSLRQDFGQVQLGTKPDKKIVALGEHRFVTAGDEEFAKIFRVFPGPTDLAKLQSLNVDVWEDEVESEDVQITEAELLHWKSYFNIVFLTPDVSGQVFKWDNANFSNDQGQDFPADNKIGDLYLPSVLVVITPAGAQGDRYQVHYSLRIDGPSASAGFVKMAALINGTEVASKTHVIPANPDTRATVLYPHEQIEFTRAIADGDTLTLIVQEVSTFPVDTFAVGGITHVFGLEAFGAFPGGRVVGGEITVSFWLNDVLDALAGYPNVKLFVTEDPMMGSWVEIADEGPYAQGRNTISGPIGTLQPLFWKIEIQGQVDDDDWSLIDNTAPPPEQALVYLQPYQATTTVEAHGFNKATDDDAEEGVTYSTTGEIKNELSVFKYSDGTPVKARALGVFADRLILVGVGGDKQTVGCSVSGNPRDLEGIGSDETPLQSLSDPIDEVMMFEQLGSNLGALFRRRSIWRVVPTGDPVAPLAYFPWIEKLGTDSPHTVEVVPGGIMFLGHDKQVYFLTENGPQPVGDSIQDELIRTIDDNNLALIEGKYDPWSQDYILTVRQNPNA